MLSLVAGRAGMALSRPLLWTGGGLLALFAAAAATMPSAVPIAASGVLPVAGAVITQQFGCTNVLFEPADADCPSGHFHSGVDLAAPAGTPVYSDCAGTAWPVLSVGGYGIHVLVDCGAGLQMLYGHLSALAITGASAVAAGSPLGWVGSTGLSTGPHLHFEVRRGGAAVDPMPWLPAYAAGLTQGRDLRWSTR